MLLFFNSKHLFICTLKKPALAILYKHTLTIVLKQKNWNSY